MTIEIRRATIHDHGEVLALLVKWFDETLESSIPGTCAFTGIWLADLIAKHIVIIATHADKVVGTIGLRFTHFPWNNEVIALTDDFLMTDKDFRHLSVADKLIKSAKGFADEFKHILMMGHFSGTHPELKDKYLSLFHSFRYLGGNFIYKGE